MATTKTNAPTVRRWGWCETPADFGGKARKAISRRNRRRREAQAWKAEARREAA